MGLCAKIWDCLCSAVVPQVIDPKRAAAQNSSHPFPIGLIAFSGRIRAPYKILSRSVQKQKRNSISIFALIASQDLSESGKVRNSWYNTNVVRPADRRRPSDCFFRFFRSFRFSRSGGWSNCAVFAGERNRRKRWDEMRWDEMTWIERRTDDIMMRWNDIRWGEMRWDAMRMKDWRGEWKNESF